MRVQRLVAFRGGSTAQICYDINHSDAKPGFSVLFYGILVGGYAFTIGERRMY